LFDRRLTLSERAWGAGLGCLAFIALILGSFAGTALLGWILLDGGPFDVTVLLWFLPAVASIGLGAWTWRTKRTPVFASIAGILGGAGGIGFGLLLAVSGLLLKVLGALGV
jgi:hypothetical protein